MRKWNIYKPLVPQINLKRFLRQQGLIIFGSLVTALGYSLFQVPFDITAGGLSGLAIIINRYTGWWEGVLFFIMNIPLLVLGFYQLGRWRLIASSSLALLVFSAATDFLNHHLPSFLTQVSYFTALLPRYICNFRKLSSAIS